MLQLKNVGVRYDDKPVVSGINLALERDEILTLVGPTGCGKTTILSAIAGLVSLHEGEIRLGDWCATPTATVAPEKRGLGMVFQDFALFPHLSVEQNVAFRTKHRDQVDHWIERLGLDALRSRKPGMLSGGQRQRVALARTLAHEPSLVLLDEPLSNLDAALKDELRWEIRDALKLAEVPAVWVTHDQAEALSIGDRLGVLREGALVQLASPVECYNAPVDRFVAGFLGEACFLPGRVSRETGLAETSLGAIAVSDAYSHEGNVEVLLRPEDLQWASSGATENATVEWRRFEGNCWLYGVALDDGTELRIRGTEDSQAVEPHSRVALEVNPQRVLKAFTMD